MGRNIERDFSRFNKIVRGKVRENLRKYITHGEMLGRKGRETVSIPVPNINIPHFQHGEKGSGGVGQGEGDVGQPIAKGQGDQQGEGAGEAGDQPGGHIREVELSLEELASMLGEELELPNIEPKGNDTLKTRKDKYSSIRRTGPNSLRHFKRTYKNALKRQIISQIYNAKKPVIIPNKDDEMYRSWKTVNEPDTNAAIIYIMDVSGSMTDDQKEIVRTEAFWIDTWLKTQYDGLERRYVVHDAVAHEVNEETFYQIRESGGTKISSAYELTSKIINKEFPPEEWNIYIFQFSDGDNWGDDNTECMSILKDKLLPVCNLYCYGQVKSPYGSGDFILELNKIKHEYKNMILSKINNREDIYKSIKEFLSTGK